MTDRGGIASLPLVSPTAGLQGLSMGLLYAGLAPSAYTALLPRWRLRKFGEEWMYSVLIVEIVEFLSQVDSIRWSQSMRLLVPPSS